ncbi:MAG: hypothetical protein Q9191_002726 [Dirinaria sp. TL-2023a]
MASVRSRAQVPVGSSKWILVENEQIAQFGTQEAEDFTFAARNEIEWLNEHMNDIFTKSQLDVTEIFKTPGKLRGKTPRTARKRNHLENRQPLTDVFSTNSRLTPNPSRRADGTHGVIKPAVPASVVSPVNVKVVKTNTDSGYHGMSEDEMGTDEIMAENVPLAHSQNGNQDTDSPLPKQSTSFRPQVERATTTDGSFHSAREELLENESVKGTSQETSKMESGGAGGTSANSQSPKQTSPERKQQPDSDMMQVDEQNDDSPLDDPTEGSRSPSQGSSPVKPLLRKSSLTFASLPAREPLTTKKSIGASVSRPSHADQAKGPLDRGSFLGRFTSGKSLGAAKTAEVGSAADNAHKDEMDIDQAVGSAIAREESDGDARLAKLHNKSSTQRLHDKISMLGKSQSARPTKSITTTMVSHPPYPELPSVASQLIAPSPLSPSASKIPTSAPEDDDDDWIKPPPAQSSQAKRPQLPKSTTADVMENIRGKQHIGDEEFGPGSYDDAKFREPPHRQADSTHDLRNGNTLARSASVTAITPPSKDADTKEETRPQDESIAPIPRANDRDELTASTTPIKTPRSKQNVDGPISASKSKLQSIMKTARGLFTSSAGISAQAKIEALSSPSTLTRSKFGECEPSAQHVAEKVDADTVQTLHRDSPKKELEGRRTRSSTEKEEKRKQQEEANRLRADAESKSARNAHREPDPGQIQSNSVQSSKPTRQSPRRLQKPVETEPNMETADANSNAVSGTVSGQSMGPPQTQPPQLQRPKDKRPVKPAKEAASKPKPQTIRVGALSQQRIPLSNAALSSSLQESLPPAQTRPPGPVKKPSNASIQTSASNPSLKTSVSSASTKPKALLAAERKKEQARHRDFRKKEIERKRAAQQEEMRQQERLQREEAENRQRERERSAASEDPKRVASRQLIEKRRLELAKKDQQRVPQRPINESAAPPERAGAPTHRPELGGTRPPSRLHMVQDQVRPATNHPPPNPVRPALKRVMEPEADDRSARPQAGSTYQQNEGKRRRTGDEDRQPISVRPTMAPPIRQSNIRKVGIPTKSQPVIAESVQDLHKSSVFNSNYSTAPPPSAIHHQGSTILKANGANNNTYQQHATHQQLPRPGQHPHDMAKYTHNRPPFADAPNPPAAASSTTTTTTTHHKTPLPSKLPSQPSKPSPQQQFINGENIHLEDIPTDDDSESDTSPPAGGGRRPTVAEWVQSPNLRELLRRQEETMNPDLIFGPQQSPHMEEMFKDRHQRFRNRTSSAAWCQDRLTSEEIQRDVEARERLRREGGWTFGL